jgi:hypothetical protein
MTETVQAETPEEAATNAAPEKQEQQVAESAPAKETKDDSDAVEKVRSRIDELTRYRREAERDRDYWRELALRNQQPREPEPQKPVQSAPKTLADFEYDEGKYQAYLFEQAEQRAVTAAEKRLKEQQEAERAERRKQSFAQREKDFAKDKADYHEKTRDPRVPITQAMADVIAESDDGPALAYYLASNLAQADQIAQLSPLAAARELGRIEARLASERERAKEAEKRVSQAPPPPAKVEGSGDSPNRIDPDTPDSDKLTMTEWLKRREKQVSQRRK